MFYILKGLHKTFLETLFIFLLLVMTEWYR